MYKNNGYESGEEEVEVEKNKGGEVTRENDKGLEHKRKK